MKTWPGRPENVQLSGGGNRRERSGENITYQTVSGTTVSASKTGLITSFRIFSRIDSGDNN